MLSKNIVEPDRNTDRKERIPQEELTNYVRQSPTKKFLGTNLNMWIYCASDSTKNDWWNRTLRKIGDAPTILDSAAAKRSADNIQAYMRARGYLDAKASYSVKTKRHKATVTYDISQGEPYRIGTVSYRFRDEFLLPVVMQDSARTLVRSGEIFDKNILNSERSRITDNLKNKGYYNFTVNNIVYLADSTAGNRTINLTISFRQYLAGYTPQGDPIYENHPIYRLRNIYINPDFDPLRTVADDDYYDRLDTLDYRGLSILHETRPKVRESVLRRAVNLYPNELYNAADVQQAYSNIMRLGYFRSANIVFDNAADSTAQNLVTFIGSGDEDYTSENTTAEHYMDCIINCTPATKQNYKIELEGSTSSNFFALGATVGYQNRNLFRGAELFDISLTYRHEFMRDRTKKASFEIGGSTSLSFPEFVTPFRVDRYNRLVNPRTKLELSMNYQHRPYYTRTLSSIKFGYSWSNRHNSSFALRPADINFVKIGYMDEDFQNDLEQLGNRYLIESYKSQLVAGLSGSFTYNTQLRSLNAHSNAFLFRLNFETMGNLFSLLTNMFSSPTTEGGSKYYRILGNRFAQYVRIDANVSQRWVLGAKTSIVGRFVVGGGIAYGNSNSIPFDRLFYSGGSNSMRGWIARTLGPGSTPKSETSLQYRAQLGNFRLEANAEFRFPVWGILNGALFFDAGNVWYLNKNDVESGNADNQVFRPRTFVSQLGFNTGIGVRFDLGFFVIRADWGIKLHDPSQPAGSRWIHKFNISDDTALNIGVGYPF
jgi:outer membrane protein assembly factor BamA